MRQIFVDEHARRLAEDRSSSFRGSALVRLEDLDFGVEGSRMPDGKNIKKLSDIFAKVACKRLEPENRIPVVISQQALDEAMKLSHITPQALLEPPQRFPTLTFPPGFHLQCYEGRSRVEAAKNQMKTMLPEDRWWAVDLYLESISWSPHIRSTLADQILGAGPELRRNLMEQYSNAANFSDGEIYLKICHYQEQGQMSLDKAHNFAEKCWWARLSNNKQDNLTRLFKHKVYRNAFDKLRSVPALCRGLRLARMKDLISMRCPKEVEHYLVCHVMGIWTAILSGRTEWMLQLDVDTVEYVQQRAPGKCLKDRQALKEKINAGTLFPFVTDLEERNAIWQNLLRITTLIPSLYTFFEDIKFLMPLTKIMKRLLGETLGESIRQSLEEIFTGNEHKELLVQESESSGVIYAADLKVQVNMGIFQLWLFAARNFTDMLPETPRKEDSQPAPTTKEPNPAAWCAFATLAYNLGFNSDKICQMRRATPDRELARMVLLRARKAPRFKYDSAAFEEYQNQIIAMFTTAKEEPAPSVAATLYTDGYGEDMERRCGRAFENAYEDYRKVLFLRVMCDLDGEGNGISSLFVRVSIILAFFGQLIKDISGVVYLRGPVPLCSGVPSQTDMQVTPFLTQQNKAEDLRLRNEMLEKEVSVFRKQVPEIEDKFKRRLNKLESDNQQQQVEISRILKEKEVSEKEHRDKMQEVQILQAELSQCQSQLRITREHQHRITETAEEFHKLEAGLLQCKSELQITQDHRQKVAEEAQKLQAELDMAVNECKVAAGLKEEAEIRSKQGKIEELSQLNSRAKTCINSLKTKNDRFRTELDSKTAALDYKNGETKNLREEIQTLKQQMAIPHPQATAEQSTPNRIRIEYVEMLDDKASRSYFRDHTQEEVENFLKKQFRKDKFAFQEDGKGLALEKAFDYAERHHKIRLIPKGGEVVAQRNIGPSDQKKIRVNSGKVSDQVMADGESGA
ncbi:hypothetical protein ACJ73_03562 [Blastomyces percursus]|uniref:Uncharacterized protein n=1 Tax=Blastomyces percursus TaxID=1658174 RepID=A0A1J9Q8F4_9EURO|nr:hypothetical protein ACJ73_03562 [Blastomyces percursus]